MPVISTIKMTADQFRQLGDDPPGVRLELVNGDVAVSPSITPEHSYVDTALRSLLHFHVTEHDLGQIFGDVDTVFGPHDVRRPDLLYFSKNRLHLVRRQKLDGPPDLAIEIISPSSSTTDRVDKFQQYQSGGIQHYWIVDPLARRIEGYDLHKGKYVAAGAGRDDEIIRLAPFPTLDIPLARIWFPTNEK